LIVMNLEELKNGLPDYAKDIKLNLSTLMQEEALNLQQHWGTFLVSALAGRNPDVIKAVEAESSKHLTPEAMTAARAANAVMAMNNIYYKFTGMLPEYRELPAKLRMNVIGNPGVDKLDFELWSLAVSAINGCQYCVAAHEKKLIEAGVERIRIQTAVRIASVIHAVSVVRDTVA
jgi:lipoyl-dependent peroxiredoxin subunit D